MKKTTLNRILIISLILLNGILVFVIVSKRNHPPKRKSIVSIVTDFDTKTREKIVALEQAHFKTKDQLMEESSKLHAQLFTQLSAPKNNKIADSIIQLINENQRENVKMTFEYFQKIIRLCNQQQQNKIQRLIHGAFDRMEGKHPHQPR
ncbi:MAG: hypothetical protein RIT10_1622 [Bacteroidota bacterium]|jgi:hypothetical protein